LLNHSAALAMISSKVPTDESAQHHRGGDAVFQ
jgi:hypothetical protein